MKLLRLGGFGNERPAVLDSGGRTYDLSRLTRDIDGPFLASGGVERVRAALGCGELPLLDGEGMRIGAPVARPGKVVCVGLNYRDHAAETGVEVPPRPVVFMKDPSTVVGPYDTVLIPRGSAKTDWEVDRRALGGSSPRRWCTDGSCDPRRDVGGAAVGGPAAAARARTEREVVMRIALFITCLADTLYPQTGR